MDSKSKKKKILSSLQIIKRTIAIRDKYPIDAYGSQEVWRCPNCRYYSGSSEGPPQEKCLNCGRELYVDIDSKEGWLIKIVNKDNFVTFEFVKES